MDQPLEDDGLTTREAGPWVEDKLAILTCYFPAFSRACQRARRWYYVDGFAGSGVNVVKRTGHRIPGSALRSLLTEPPFTRCLLMESGAMNVRALARRTARFGDRAIVRRGDANQDLLPLMQQFTEASRPLLVLLDPEGIEVSWSTIEGLATFRQGIMKAALLILFAADGVGRVMPLWTVEPWAEPELDRFWGPNDWRRVYAARVAQHLSPDEARTEYLRLYVEGLKTLGYRWVLNREIRQRSRYGGVKDFLVFATDHKAGHNIMDWCFRKVFPREEQSPIPGLEPETGRDLG